MSGESLPDVFAFHGGARNPSNPATQIRFDLPQHAPVEIVVCNILSRGVRRVLDRALPAERHTVIWNGRDQSGIGVASGVYVVSLRAGEFAGTERITLISTQMSWRR